MQNKRPSKEQIAKWEAELKDAEVRRAHFEGKGQHDTYWHTTVKRLEGALEGLRGKEDK